MKKFVSIIVAYSVLNPLLYLLAIGVWERSDRHRSAAAEMRGVGPVGQGPGDGASHLFGKFDGGKGSGHGGGDWREGVRSNRDSEAVTVALLRS